MNKKPNKYNNNEIFPFVGIDIGGTLAKLCVSLRKESTLEFNNIKDLTIEMHDLYKIYFINFQTDNIQELIDLLKQILQAKSIEKIHITGGGAYKFNSLITESLQIPVIKVDEFESLALGLAFLKKNSRFFSFKFNYIQGEQHINDFQYPFLIVNVGSGVSILKFTSENQFERISGTPLGGATFLGLCGLLTGITDFDQLLEMSMKGDTSKVDLLIEDLYKYEDNILSQFPGFKSSDLAISMSKVKKIPANQNIDNLIENGENIIKKSDNFQQQQNVKKEDLVKSLVQMIAFNIAQISFLYAQINQIDHVYFAGNFIRHHHQTMDCINSAFEFFNKQGQNIQKHCVFFKHDGYIGALGCFNNSLKSFQLTKKKLSI